MATEQQNNQSFLESAWMPFILWGVDQLTGAADGPEAKPPPSYGFEQNTWWPLMEQLVGKQVPPYPGVLDPGPSPTMQLLTSFAQGMIPGAGKFKPANAFQQNQGWKGANQGNNPLAIAGPFTPGKVSPDPETGLPDLQNMSFGGNGPGGGRPMSSGAGGMSGYGMSPGAPGITGFGGSYFREPGGGGIGIGRRGGGWTPSGGGAPSPQGGGGEQGGGGGWLSGLIDKLVYGQNEIPFWREEFFLDPALKAVGASLGSTLLGPLGGMGGARLGSSLADRWALEPGSPVSGLGSGSMSFFDDPYGFGVDPYLGMGTGNMAPGGGFSLGLEGMNLGQPGSFGLGSMRPGEGSFGLGGLGRGAGGIESFGGSTFRPEMPFIPKTIGEVTQLY